MSDSRQQEEGLAAFPPVALTESTIRPALVDVPGFLCGRCGSIELGVDVAMTGVGQMVIRLTCRRCGNRRQQVLEALHGDNRN
jgi:hypothetical protein